MSKHAIFLCFVLFASTANALSIISNILKKTMEPKEHFLEKQLTTLMENVEKIQKPLIKFDELFFNERTKATDLIANEVAEKVYEATREGIKQMYKDPGVDDYNQCDCKFQELYKIATDTISKNKICIDEALKFEVDNILEKIDNGYTKLNNVMKETQKCKDKIIGLWALPNAAKCGIQNAWFVFLAFVKNTFGGKLKLDVEKNKIEEIWKNKGMILKSCKNFETLENYASNFPEKIHACNTKHLLSL